MKKIQINELFKNYLNHRETGLEPLLEAISKKALLKLRDEDAAQDFVIDMMELLPTLTNEIDASGATFLALLNQRLRWRGVNSRTRVSKEEQFPELFEEDGEIMSTQDTIDILQWNNRPSEPVDDYDYHSSASIDDDFLRSVADMLLRGKTQDQVAAYFGISREVLHRKILRHLESAKN